MPGAQGDTQKRKQQQKTSRLGDSALQVSERCSQATEQLRQEIPDRDGRLAEPAPAPEPEPA